MSPKLSTNSHRKAFKSKRSTWLYTMIQESKLVPELCKQRGQDRRRPARQSSRPYLHQCTGQNHRRRKCDRCRSTSVTHSPNMRGHDPGPFSPQGPSRQQPSPGDHSQGSLASGRYLATASQRWRSECAQRWSDWRGLEIWPRMTEVVWVGPSGTNDKGWGSGRVVGHQAVGMRTKKLGRVSDIAYFNRRSPLSSLDSIMKLPASKEESGRRGETVSEDFVQRTERRRSAPKREVPGMSCADRASPKAD